MDNVVVDYGVAYTADLDIYITANPEAVAAAFTPAAGDTKISTNRGVTFTNTTNACTFANGIISVVLTATEMQAARIILKFQDQDAALVNDAMFEIYTKNHASAFYTGIDLNTDASGNVTLAAATHTGAVIPTVTTLTGHTAQTGDTYALANGATGFAAIDTVVDSILVDTGTTIPATIATAQADLDTITGADGAALASTQQSITFQPITITAGDAIANITLAGTGTEDGIKFSRSGSGDPFDANIMAQINAEIDAALSDYDAATGTELAATEAKIDIIDTNIDAVLVDTGTTLPATLAAQDAIITEARLAELDAANLPAVIDAILAMLDDPRAEPAQGAPAVNADMATKLDYLYKAWRNKTEQTATTLSVYNDAGTVVDHKSTVSDDGTTATKAEIVAGP